jgi:hypothetical protein
MIAGKTISIVSVSNIKKPQTINSIINCCKKFPFFDKKIFFTDEDGQYEDIKLKNINLVNPDSYNNFVINNLYKYIDTDFVLIVHYDGTIINESLWDNKFLNYDYVGAPWPFNNVNMYTSDNSIDWQGNGGFCLRSRKFLYISSKIGESNLRPAEYPEDVYLSIINRKLFELHNCVFAPINLCKKFSFENKFDENHTIQNSFGIHGKHNYNYIINFLNEYR